MESKPERIWDCLLSSSCVTACGSFPLLSAKFKKKNMKELDYMLRLSGIKKKSRLTKIREKLSRMVKDFHRYRLMILLAVVSKIAPNSKYCSTVYKKFSYRCFND
jgi:hypothetical protein